LISVVKIEKTLIIIFHIAIEARKKKLKV